MPKYIDLDKVKITGEMFLDDDDEALIPLSYIRRALLMAPVEDVAPRSELELYKRQVNELEDELATTYDKLENAKAEVAREIFEEIEKILEKNHKKYTVGGYRYDYYEAVITERFAELKKKYTEDQT